MSNRIQNRNTNFVTEVIREEDIQDVCELMFRFILIKFIGFALTFVFIIFLTQINENLLIAVCPTVTAELVILMILFWHQIKTSKYLMTFAIIEIFFDIIFKIFLVICIRNNYSLVYTLTVSVIHLILNFLSCKDQAKTVFLPHLFLTNILFYLQALFIFLRMGQMITWDIYVCLWPLYIYLFFIIFSAIFKITLLCAPFQCNFKKFFKRNFEFFAAAIILSSHLYAVFLLAQLDSLPDWTVSLLVNPILMWASVPLLFCFVLMSLYCILVRSKIRKYLKEFIFFNHPTLAQINARANTEANDILATNANNPQIELVVADEKKKISDKNEAKDILKKYIKHCLPRHLVKKTNTYYVRGSKTPKKSGINRIKVHRKVISQNNLDNKIEASPNIVELTAKRAHRQSSFNNFATMQLKENQNPIQITPGTPDSNLCILCCEREPNAVFMDCGHGGMCYICCIKMWKNGNECHICRSKISEVLQVILDKDTKGKYSIVSATFTLDQEKIDKFKQDYENDENNKINGSSVDVSQSQNSRDVNISIIDI